MKEFICELCATANWQPVLGRDGHQVGRLVRCAGCNAVYEQPLPPPPRMWGDKPAGPPRLKQGWADLPLDGNGDRGDGGD